MNRGQRSRAGRAGARETLSRRPAFRMCRRRSRQTTALVPTVFALVLATCRNKH